MKLEKSTYPKNHSASDFQCFGPPATKDGEFENTLICDMGCFTQDGKDSNKFYHGAVVQSTKDKSWYSYFEWGRVGAKNPQFQFVSAASKEAAIRDYCSQLHEKNDKRGQWIQHPTLGKILQAKAGKDCYLVRPQASRSTGLPDARTIKFNEGTNNKPQVSSKSAISKVTADSKTVALMRDLNVATLSYTKGAMTDDCLPTFSAISEARDILSAALSRLSKVGNDLNDQVADTELNSLTKLIYGRIPKKKDRGAAPETWILNQNNITFWQQDLDAFESALSIEDNQTQTENDVFGGMSIKMEWLSPTSENGKFVYNWFPKATRNRHSYLGKMDIQNVWYVERKGDVEKISTYQNKIGNVSTREIPLHQPDFRNDLNQEENKIFKGTNTSLLIHGTRSVNVRGILDKALMLPRNLVGVSITGAMFGPGLYFADDWKKSAGYTSLSSGLYSSGSGGIRGRGAFMFLADVVLGDPYVAPRSSGYTSPPNGKHCIFGKAGHSGVQNNEWIVFNTNQHRLRYLVEFKVA